MHEEFCSYCGNAIVVGQTVRNHMRGVMIHETCYQVHVDELTNASENLSNSPRGRADYRRRIADLPTFYSAPRTY